MPGARDLLSKNYLKQSGTPRMQGAAKIAVNWNRMLSRRRPTPQRRT